MSTGAENKSFSINGDLSIVPGGNQDTSGQFPAQGENGNLPGLQFLAEINPEAAKEIMDYHSQINQQIEQAGDKMKVVVEEHEKDFLAAFEQKMYTIQKDFKDLKQKASAERHKAKNDARIITLEEERDWFRQEALTLDKINKEQKKRLESMRFELESVKEEKTHIYDQLVRSTGQLQATTQECDDIRRQLLMKPTFAKPLPLPAPDRASKLSQMAEKAAAVAAQDDLLAITYDDIQTKYDKVLQENENLHSKIDKQQDEIRQIKGLLDQQKRLSRGLQTDAANFQSQKNELEELFAQCVNEVKKDIQKRRQNQNPGTSQTSLKQNSNSKPNNINNITADSFTAQDKKQVIENLMSNENVLLFLYEKLFPGRADPVVRELTTSDSFVFLGHKNYNMSKPRVSQSSVPSTAFDIISQSGQGQSPGGAGRISNQRASSKGKPLQMQQPSYQYQPHKICQSQRFQGGAQVNLSSAETLFKQKPHQNYPNNMAGAGLIGGAFSNQFDGISEVDSLQHNNQNMHMHTQNNLIGGMVTSSGTSQHGSQSTAKMIATNFKHLQQHMVHKSKPARVQTAQPYNRNTRQMKRQGLQNQHHHQHGMGGSTRYVLHGLNPMQSDSMVLQQQSFNIQ